MEGAVLLLRARDKNLTWRAVRRAPQRVEPRSLMEEGSDGNPVQAGSPAPLRHAILSGIAV